MKSRCPRAENCVGIQAAGGLLSNGAELWDGSDGARQEVKKGAGGKLGSYCPDKFLFVCLFVFIELFLFVQASWHHDHCNSIKEQVHT